MNQKKQDALLGILFLTATDYNPGMYLLALPVIHCIYRSNG